MSGLAASLAGVECHAPRREPKTPCFPLYGYGDVDDQIAINRLRAEGNEWATVHTVVDDLLDITDRISTQKFIRHWRGLCSCWNETGSSV